MQRAVLFIVLAAVAHFGPASAQMDQASTIQQQILGTSKLVSYVREEIPSGAKSDVMGAHPSGYINCGRDGRMIVLIVGSDRKKPAGPVATPEEAEALIRSMLAYTGAFTVNNKAKTVTHHADVTWDQSRTGESLLRTFKLEGDQLTLTTPPSEDPATGQKTVRKLIWESWK